MKAYESSVATLSSEPGRPSVSRSRILPLDHSWQDRWDSFVAAHPAGTFFHLTSWMRVMEKTYGYTPCYYFAERDGQITGVAPAFLLSNWFTGRCLISLPFAVYGGVCALDSETEDDLITQLEQIAEKEGVEYLELRNRDGAVRSGYHENSRYATFTLPLAKDPGKTYAAFPKDIRYMIRKAEKANLCVRRGLDQLQVFYHLLTVNLRRLGTPAFPMSLFENLVQEYGNQVDLTVVYSSDKPVAGGMSFFFRDWMQPTTSGPSRRLRG